ncbi:MAG: ArsR/SmtB family transcription factor [Gemmataceae bacterium]
MARWIITDFPNCHPGDHTKDKAASSFPQTLVLEKVERLFRALGDGGRLRLLLLLAEREWCVSEIVEALGEKFPTVSQRLRLLHTERLVTRRREGTHIYYSLADDHVLKLLNNAIEHAEEPEGSTSAESPPGTSAEEDSQVHPREKSKMSKNPNSRKDKKK